MTAEQLRSEVRDWLAAHWTGLSKSDDPWVSSPERVAWLEKVLDAGYAVPTYPVQWYGRDYPNDLAAVIEQEFRAVKAPGARQDKYSIPANTVLKFGSEALKHELLRGFLTERSRTCLLYSEPGAGSDLAAVRTTAVRDGQDWVVNGQKVWTSGAQFADWIYMLVRTDPAAPKHKGISYLLVDMKTPGITVRPLVLMNGHRHFNEVFFVDVRVPKANLIGRQNEGWKPAMTTLMYERKSGGSRGFAEQLGRLRSLAGELRVAGRSAWEDPLVRQGFAQLWIEATCLKYTRLRNITRQLRGEPPGPEGSILKLFGSELGVRIADFAGGMLGSHVLINRPSDAVPDGPRWYNRVVSARQYTIAGGTSEIQRNIIGERVLGLPKD